ncbi:HypC/HybG/HupF family hydrogenase formation chaperone [Actinotalea sp. AC32]|nr:HypC/HybG/HupF family hydrogenase formation chaperone [Actinotalea sp. AC32]
MREVLPDRHVVVDGARTLRVSLLALDGPVAEGDWLLVHAGLALERLTEAEAREALALRAGDEPPDGGAPDQPPDGGAPDEPPVDPRPDAPTGDPT